MRNFIFVALAATCILQPLGVVHAKPAPQVAEIPYRPLDPAEPAKVPFETVSGSITVRLNGVLVNAQDVTYIFSPEFKANAGSLKNTEDGTYFLKTDNVPNNQPYTLVISATYNSTVKGKDGVVESVGATYTGAIKLDVPYGSDFDFGVQFIELH